MKQIIQHLKSGETEIVTAPNPRPKHGHLNVETSVSLISAGTERMLVDFSKSNLVQKARQQPDKVKQVLNKVQTDGLMTTVDAVKAKLNEPLPLGYSNVGQVSEPPVGLPQFKLGDRVVSNGSHATMVRVPGNLCAKIPDNVDDQTASFTVVGAIALQGIRLAQPTLGECVVVIGAGLIGLMAIQLLKAHGCRVLAVDPDGAKLALAEQFGAETCNPANGDSVQAAHAFSRGNGVDAVIIAASTKSNDVIKNAAQMCRMRGRIVLVGVVGLDLDRADFYDKELTFQVSCSYGPGRYDPAYEEQGMDYPIGFVRWTEQRNFEAVLDLMNNGAIDVGPLVTHTFAFTDAAKAYTALSNDAGALGIVLEYAQAKDANQTGQTVELANRTPVAPSASVPVCGFVGAGNYASRILIPAFKKAGGEMHTLVTTAGLSAAVQGQAGDFQIASTDSEAMFADPAINTIAIATQHNSHAALVAQGLTAGKNVFVEKPLALTDAQLSTVRDAYEEAHQSQNGPRLMVGFNRRFAPQIQKTKALLENKPEPKSIIITVNAGAIPADHWTQNEELGGGRILGEACHFVDLLQFLTGSKIVSASARRMGDTPTPTTVEDVCTITLGFVDGSFGTIHYFANGANNFPKERIEVFCAGGILAIDNFRKMQGYNWPGFKKFNLRRQDKGQAACAEAFLNTIREGGPSPIPEEELFESHEVLIRLVDDLRQQ